ncbi:MAG: sugar phosphate isomerase/epimerase [Alistipes sp.]|nr:sugar phosphate isomerase/epimerase [Alistipes sp.]
MFKLLLSTISMLLVSCGTAESPSGPDWSKVPQKPGNEELTPEPEPTPEPTPEPSVMIIEPTTTIAPEDEDISNLQYTPGMQINVDDNTFTARLEEVAAAGFKYVELKIKYAYGLHNKSDEQANATFASMQQQLEAKGIKVWSVHLPYEDKNWTSISAAESIRTQSVEYILRTLRLCAANFPTCKNYVLHASKSVSPSATALAQAHKSLTEMDAVAKQLGVRFCVENLVGSYVYTIEDVLKVVEPFENVYTTFDIGHANCKGYDVVNFLESLGTKLGTVHIHDTFYKSGTDDHQLVGDGDLATKNRPWGEVYKTMLTKNRYRGVFMFEPKDNQKAEEVMRRFNEVILPSYENLGK